MKSKMAPVLNAKHLFREVRQAVSSEGSCDLWKGAEVTWGKWGEHSRTRANTCEGAVAGGSVAAGRTGSCGGQYHASWKFCPKKRVRLGRGWSDFDIWILEKCHIKQNAPSNPKKWIWTVTGQIITTAKTYWSFFFFFCARHCSKHRRISMNYTLLTN